MIVEVVGGADERPEVRVVETHDLTSLHLALGQVTDEEADEALRAAGLGRVEGETGHLDTAALRAAAEPAEAPADWVQRWDAMVEQARSRGWAADDGARMQVHVERAAGA